MEQSRDLLTLILSKDAGGFADSVLAKLNGDHEGCVSYFRDVIRIVSERKRQEALKRSYGTVSHGDGGAANKAVRMLVPTELNTSTEGLGELGFMTQSDLEGQLHILVENKRLGALIGKGGSNIRLLEKASGAKVQVEKEVKHWG
jgi:hypothetical protein